MLIEKEPEYGLYLHIHNSLHFNIQYVVLRP